MRFFNKLLIEALFSRNYICPKCGSKMIFEDEKWADSLICLKCGHSMALDDYGVDQDEFQEQLMKEYREIYGDDDEDEDDDEDDSGEYYEEETDELSHDD